MPRLTRNTGRYGCPTYTQASKIIARFGGEKHIAEALGINRITVYRWTYAAPYGTDGLVPAPRIDRIKTVAREQGVFIHDDDWVVEVAEYDEQTIERVEQARARPRRYKTVAASAAAQS